MGGRVQAELLLVVCVKCFLSDTIQCVLPHCTSYLKTLDIPQTDNYITESECTNLNQISCLYFKISCYLLCLTSPERITEVCKYLGKLSFVLVLGKYLCQLKIDGNVKALTPCINSASSNSWKYPIGFTMVFAKVLNYLSKRHFIDIKAYFNSEVFIWKTCALNYRYTFLLKLL